MYSSAGTAKSTTSPSSSSITVWSPMPAPSIDATWAWCPQAWAAWVVGSAKGWPATISESSSPRIATVGPGRRPDIRALTPVSASPDRYFTPILSSRVPTNSAVRASR